MKTRYAPPRCCAAERSRCSDALFILLCCLILLMMKTFDDFCFCAFHDADAASASISHRSCLLPVVSLLATMMRSRHTRLFRADTPTFV